MAARAKSTSATDSADSLDFEAKLWLSADPALRARAFQRTGGKLHVMTERQANLRKDDDVRWQRSGATWTTEG